MTVKQDWIRAAQSLAGVVDRLPRERWDAPALGTWSLRELVGHATSAGVREVIFAAGRAAPVEDITSPEAYYALVQTVDPDTYATAVAASDEDARAAAEALGADPAGALRALVEQATAAVESLDPVTVVTTAAGGMRLDTWLPTRVFELVMHGIDIARAAGVEDGIPQDLIARAAVLAAHVATTVGHERTMLLALTGRGDLPPHFSVLEPGRGST